MCKSQVLNSELDLITHLQYYWGFGWFETFENIPTPKSYPCIAINDFHDDFEYVYLSDFEA